MSLTVRLSSMGLRRQGREARKGWRGRLSRDRDRGDSVKAAAARRGSKMLLNACKCS